MIDNPLAGTCPCGGKPEGAAFADCCGPALSGARWPETAESLMRSRYTAFALADEDHLFRTWHPRTRPAGRLSDADTRWTGLELGRVIGGGAEDKTGTVEFTAHYVGAGAGPGVMHCVSTFARRAGRWMYVEDL
ncbi:YchJ family metal-binding protein [Brevibacterium sp. 50QC2O2]|jgi:SEC-C motif-containing protein|uniref:YchJ family protein n=1 Tax=Brevibacterium sp. 50QC2O2 TaxID=2968459 RepID=UPI00211C9EF6|nr:YchJ family metal-binding protein [Brevibacterium sp. 50QC2O2]MCQ9387482.1 YchJ family metal-binding protein [Brevibacterium sp. 50QC2O2]